MRDAVVLVPRIFHRIWLGGKPMPEEFERWGQSWLTCHPRWTMKLWTEVSLPRSKRLTARLAAAETLTERSDILRYEIVLREGGVYIDTDFECRKNIEPLIAGCDMFAAYQHDDAYRSLGSINGAFFGAVPGHPVVQALVDNIEANPRRIRGRWGPRYFTHYLQQYPGVTVFDRKLFYPYIWNEPRRPASDFPDAYAVHHWSSNWLPSSQAPLHA